MHPKHYHIVRIPKRGGGWRQIEEPHDWLKIAQKRLLGRLNAIPVSEAAHGFVPGRSPVTNARTHAGRPYLVQFDIQDFFPAVSKPMIIHSLYMCGLSYSDAEEIAQTCSFGNRLPQGAPTSPALANIAAKHLDRRLIGLAEKYEATYTRYADDMTFSFDEDEGLYELRYPVARILKEERFQVNKTKTRILRPHHQQRITGVVSSHEGSPQGTMLSAPRKERRRLRARIHQWGLGQNEDDQLEHLLGMASWIYSINPVQGKAFYDQIEAASQQREALGHVESGSELVTA